MDYAYDAIDPKLGKYYDGPKSEVGFAGRIMGKRDCPHPLPQSVYYGNQGGNWDPEYHRDFASNQNKDTRYSTDFDAENWKSWTFLSCISGAVHGRFWQYTLWRGMARGQSWTRCNLSIEVFILAKSLNFYKLSDMNSILVYNMRLKIAQLRV